MFSCAMTPVENKINGVSLEMPPDPIADHDMATLKKVNADWVAMIPYGFSRGNVPTVNFHNDGRWWGESVKGVAGCIQMAKDQGLKVMVKPHVWVRGQGWPGDFDVKEEALWKEWEESYSKYILTFAALSDSMHVDLFCIGTEYRKPAAERTEFWRKLIREVRAVYGGKVTYAANWDNYQNVKFWDDLDYIGVDAYFPLSREARPSIDLLKENWKKVETELKAHSDKYQLPILFTEYGYKSVEYSNSGHWNYEEDTVKTSMANQVNAYEALFQSVWQKDWMAGGFLWKWHMRKDREYGGPENRRYTPQGKTTIDVVAKWYGTGSKVSSN